MQKLLAKIIPLSWLEAFEHFILKDYSRTKQFLRNANPAALDIISRRKALRTFQHTAEHVPAYTKFLKKNRVPIDQITIPDLFDALVPQTDKATYVKEYSYEDRCIGGRLPKVGNIDESSGSSGNPTNWIRSIQEEDLLFKAARFEFNYLFKSDQEDYIIISAWSSGPWATGVKFCVIAEHLGLVKNTTEEIDDIIKSMKLFGPKYKYIIAGYPPFIKHMVDSAQKKLNWKKYQVHIITGGEGIAYGWNEYIASRLKKGSLVYSSYGASDVDIGIGFETPFCQFVRGCIAKNKSLHKKLMPNQTTIPMLFQYNPTVHYIHTTINQQNGKEEFQITLLDKNVASPKIKYNLHDEGAVYPYNRLLELLLEEEPKKTKAYLAKNKHEILKLPFLLVLGRTDGTISLDGANIYPSQLDRAIRQNKPLAKKTVTFRMSKAYDKKKNVQFIIKIQLQKGVKPSKQLEKQYFKTIIKNLQEINADFKQSYTKDASVIKPTIKLFSYSHKDFEKTKIKNTYIE